MHVTWILGIMVVLVSALTLFLLHRTSLGDLIHEHIPDRPRRRLFLASVSFFLTFAGVLFAPAYHRFLHKLHLNIDKE